MAGRAIVLLGVDDTDSLKGGCTTYVALQLVLRLEEELGLVPLDHPRLVRLNPTNPWKTRGNAALALRLGRPAGGSKTIGEWEGRPIRVYPEGQDVQASVEALETAWSTIVEHTWEEDGRTNPGLVLANESLGVRRYRDAMHTIVDPATVGNELKGLSVFHKGSGTQRGLVGAVAAISWPGHPHTWELLTYREGDRWGSKRRLDVDSVRTLDSEYPNTFDSYDPETCSVVMAPSSPCPVLYGIRGTDGADLVRAQETVVGERPIGWMVFRTNQATDDHLVPKEVRDVGPFESVATVGKVSSAPRTIHGGHVLVDITDGEHEITLAAYEPTKSFREVVKRLVPGDVVLVCGSIRDEPRSLNLEKLKVLSMASQYLRLKVANPRCPACDRAMKSIGAGAGYRCARCGLRRQEEDAVWEEAPRDLSLTWYEVPPSARRHLARPLKLGVRDDISHPPTS